MICGGLTSVILIMAVFFAMWYASINSLYASMVIGSMITNSTILLGIPIAGVALCFITKYYRLKYGEIDIKMAFMEIPP